MAREMGVSMPLLSGIAYPTSSIAAIWRESDPCSMVPEAALMRDRVLYALSRIPMGDAEIARVLKITRQSVKGWRDTGRISKTNLRKLAELADLNYEQLANLDVPLDQIGPAGTPLRWPFPNVAQKLVLALPPPLLEKVETFLMGVITSAGGFDPVEQPKTRRPDPQSGYLGAASRRKKSRRDAR